MSCNTNGPVHCRVDVWQTSGCNVEAGKVGAVQAKTYVTPYDVIYPFNGTIMREFNHDGLRLPQKREFLGPQYFGGGCSALYGSSEYDSVPGVTKSHHDLNNMPYVNAFVHEKIYEGNNPPPCISNCSKCDTNSPNSVHGWVLSATGKPLWQTTK